MRVNQSAMPRNASSLRIRQIEPGDRDRLAAAFDRLSPRSRYLRFMAHKPKLSDAELTYLTDVDHVTHEALGAFDPSTGELVGVARYATFSGSGTTADLAVTVVDEWQRVGLGTMLAHRIVYRAADNEIERLEATTLVDNLAARALLRRLGFRAHGRDADVLELGLDLEPCGCAPLAA